ncbi:MAG: large conductance mechanosensitive channel protein MscL [Actinomycetota bacterium]|nr:large conductance mechanosensitive channel protein MscL [Actinomycetota bacterium]
MKGFKEFLLRGNLLDLAVAVVVGTAFAAVVKALVADLLTPLIAAIGGQSNFANLTFTVHHSTFLYGDFVNAVLSFVVIAAVVFFAVARPVTGFLGRLGRLPQEQPMHPCPFCLTSVPVAATRCAQCTSELEAGAS